MSNARQFFLMAGVVIQILGIMTSASAEETTVVLLDRLSCDDGRTVFRANAEINWTSRPHVSLDEHVVSAARIHVSRQTLDSWEVVYEERFPKVQKYKTSARFPGWNCMFLPPATFRLPTAKLYEFDGAVYLCVAYDKTLKVYKFDEPTLQMKPVKIEKAFFRSMFADTFCADDIYWNYAILMNADYLGLEPDLGELNVGTSSSSKDFFQAWKSIAETLVP